MKKQLLASLALICASANASTITTTATFNQLTEDSSLGQSYTENGITLSGSGMTVTTTYDTNALFGWGAGIDFTPAIFAWNSGWITISAQPPMFDVSFLYGFDWNGYLIEAAALTTQLQWQTWSNGTMTGSGAITHPPRPPGFGGNYHAGDTVDFSDPNGFTELRVRSISDQYGNLNLIALDNVRATYDPPDPHSVPDASATALLLAAAGIIASLRFRASTS